MPRQPAVKRSNSFEAKRGRKPHLPVDADGVEHPLDRFDYSCMDLLHTSVVWDSEEGKSARRKLWRNCDAPSSTGKVSIVDVDRWVRSVLGCDDNFATRPTVQQIFNAAKDAFGPLESALHRAGHRLLAAPPPRALLSPSLPRVPSAEC